MGRIAKSGFQHSKERVIIAEVFLNEMLDLKEDDQRDLVTLIKDAGNSKELKYCLKHWEPSTTGGLSSIWTLVTSFFSSKEQTSKCLDEAANKSRNTKDQEFLATLPGKVSKEPLLEQLARDAVIEAHEYFQTFMKQHLPRLYSHACEIKRQTIYRQVEVEVNDQDQKRRASARSDWFDKIKMGQPQVDSGYVQYATRCI